MMTVGGGQSAVSGGGKVPSLQVIVRGPSPGSGGQKPLPSLTNAEPWAGMSIETTTPGTKYFPWF